MFEFYLKPLQNESFLTLDEVGREHVWSMLKKKKKELRHIGVVSSEMCEPYRTRNLLRFYYLEVMNSARLHLPQFHCDRLQDKLALAHTVLPASQRATAIKPTLFKHSPEFHAPTYNYPLI